jgi:hypothetical protein
MKMAFKLCVKLTHAALVVTGAATLFGFGWLVLDEKSVSGAVRRMVNTTV